jgi:hypothetical protein
MSWQTLRYISELQRLFYLQFLGHEKNASKYTVRDIDQRICLPLQSPLFRGKLLS